MFIGAGVIPYWQDAIDNGFDGPRSQLVERLLDKVIERHRARIATFVNQVGIYPGRGDLNNLNAGIAQQETLGQGIRVDSRFLVAE